MKSRRRPVSEFPNDNNALYAGTVWLCLQPTSHPRPVTSSLALDEARAEQERNGPLPAMLPPMLPPPLQPRAIAATPPPPLSSSAHYVGSDEDFDVPELDFSFDDGPAPYELPPVAAVEVPARSTHDYVRFYPPPPDLWKRELAALNEEANSGVALGLLPPPPESPLPDVVVARLSNLTVDELGTPVSRGRAALAHAFVDTTAHVAEHTLGACAFEVSAIDGAAPIGSELPPPLRTASWLVSPLATCRAIDSIDEAIRRHVEATPPPSPALAGAWGNLGGTTRSRDLHVDGFLEEIEALRNAEDDREQARSVGAEELDALSGVLDAAFSDPVGKLPAPSASLVRLALRPSDDSRVSGSSQGDGLDQLERALDDAFDSSDEGCVAAIEPTFTSLQSFGRLSDMCTLAPPLKILANAALQAPPPYEDLPISTAAASGVQELGPSAQEPSHVLDDLRLELTPEPGEVAATRGPDVAAPALVALEIPAAVSPIAEKQADAFQRLCDAMAAVALQRGATRAAACIPRLMAGERLSVSDLSTEALDALSRNGFVEYREPYAVPTEAFASTTTAWRRLMRGESDDFSACGSDTLDTWASAVLAALLGTEPAAVRKDVRKQGIAAFGMKRAA